jgi:orotidine-5'-phosphate decarboxylase
MKPDNPIILALDTSSLTVAKDILNQVRPNIGMVKIGLELFTAHGKDALELSSDFGIPVFLDLKLYDIPTTVEKTVSVVCYMLSQHNGEHFLSIHCSGGKKMCKAAMDAAQGSNVNIAGVTALTSLSSEDFTEIGFKTTSPGCRTSDLTLLGADCQHEYWTEDPVTRNRVFEGLTNFVCAPNQLKLLTSYHNFDKTLTFITPGIRMDKEDKDDHERSKPAGFALKNGATWIVVGRPITQAKDPAAASLYFKEQADRNK